MKQVLLIIFILILAAALYVGGMILFAIITKFSPAPIESVEVINSKSNIKNINLADTTFTFLTWNVGYGGLGAEVDFFYDGGKMVTSPKEHVLKNNKGMMEFFAANNDVDFIFLQETDRNSKRSWGIDQVEEFAGVLPEHNYAFTPNYDVKWLPFPFLDPMGKVYGGLTTYSKYTPEETKRIAVANITDFPRRLFYLQRCLMTQRYKLPNGKDLFVINTHFEAYDTGEIKKQEMETARQIMEAEYAKGNYVVIGGDWNIAPPGFDVDKWEKGDKTKGELYRANNDSAYIPDWKYAFDANTPSNRDNIHAFDPATTYTTVIDYFFVSPNVDIEEVKGVDMGFKFSDHNPVKMKIRLK
jgi:endonuclease/exonuclease/phosphatase family metal-dependent hydrolase